MRKTKKINENASLDARFKKLIRGVLYLSGGAALSQLLALAFLPVITRIYTPYDMGVLSAFLASLTFVGSFCTFRYATAIPLPRGTMLAANVAAISLIVLMMTTIIVGVIGVIGLALEFSLYPGVDGYLSLLLLVSSFFLIGCYEILISILVRQQSFSIQALTKVIRAGSTEGLKVLFGAFSPAAIYLLVAIPLGLVASIVPVISRARVFFAGFSVRRRLLIRAAKAFSGFPIYQLPSEVMRVASVQAIVFYFFYTFEAEQTGFLGLATLVVTAPVILIAQAVRNVTYSEFARIGRRRVSELYSLISTVQRAIVLIGLPLILIFWFIGQEVFEVVFGLKWAEAGEFAVRLSLFLVPQLLFVSISGPLLTVLKENRAVLRFEVSRLIFVCTSLGLAFMLNMTALDTVSTFSLAVCLHFLVSHLLVLRRLKGLMKDE